MQQPAGTSIISEFVAIGSVVNWAGPRSWYAMNVFNPRRITARFPVLLLWSGFFWLAPSSAQSQPQNPGVIHVDVNLVLLDATVKTKSGQIMGDLKQDAFEIREDNVPQKIDIFNRDELPLSVALVLDLSDSIGPFLGPLRDAANAALRPLSPKIEVALFTFSTEAQLRVPFTKDKNSIGQAISSFQVGGATNINDGIFVAAQYLLNTPPKDAASSS